MADDGYELVKNLKGKSKVWSHFSLKRKKETYEIAENVAVCDRCHTLVKYSGGTTNLTTHLERHHKILKQVHHSPVAPSLEPAHLLRQNSPKFMNSLTNQQHTNLILQEPNL